MTTARRRAAVPAAAVLLLAGACSGHPSDPDPTAATSGCPDVVWSAKRAVAQAENPKPRWTGPVTGPRAVPGKRIVFVAQTMTNPGVAGVARSVRAAGRTIGWDVRVIDGRGDPAGIQSAFAQAVALRPSGIVVGGFDPDATRAQVRRAAEAGIPLIGWHAVTAPGPSVDPPLFTNVTTRVEDVAEISADWIIAHSGGRAGVVIFTDSSVPFAEYKSQLIRRALSACSGVRVLAYQNIPIPDAGIRTPRDVSSLLARFGGRWTHSVAINDLYFADAAPALRAAGRGGAGPPFSIGAGDGDPSAFERIRDRAFQAATVPEPLNAQGSQIVDEFNRAFAGRPPSGYIGPAHLTTIRNVDGTGSWDPPGYAAAYRRIWGR